MIAPRPWIESDHGVLRGERLAGVLLAVRDPAAAERALERWNAVRPFTMPDLFALDGHLGAAGAHPATGGRRGLGSRHAELVGVLSALLGLLIPVFLLGSLLRAFQLYQQGRRRTAAAMVSLAVAAAAVAILMRL